MIKSSRRVVLVVAAMALAAASAAYGAGGFPGSSSRSRNRDRDKKPSRYYVIQVRTAEGEMIFPVVGNTDYRDKLKEYEEEYRQNLIDWAKARKEAKKADQEFTEKPPAGPKFMKRWKSFKEQEDAQEFADKLQEKWDEAVAKRRAKEGEGGDPLEDDKDVDKDHKKKDE